MKKRETLKKVSLWFTYLLVQKLKHLCCVLFAEGNLLSVVNNQARHAHNVILVFDFREVI